MTLVHNDHPQEIGTHVLIIGVGNYPYLLGGSQQTSTSHGGMGQLSSPPESAKQVADWFLTTYSNPDKPLRSVSLVISADGDIDYQLPDGNSISIENASFANTSRAIREWADFGNLHNDNLIIFYFCGHGISAGPQTTLLPDNYGEDAQAGQNWRSDVYLVLTLLNFGARL